jgi:hypothetical protein
MSSNGYFATAAALWLLALALMIVAVVTKDTTTVYEVRIPMSLLYPTTTTEATAP